MQAACKIGVSKMKMEICQICGNEYDYDLLIFEPEVTVTKKDGTKKVYTKVCNDCLIKMSGIDGNMLAE